MFPNVLFKKASQVYGLGLKIACLWPVRVSFVSGKGVNCKKSAFAYCYQLLIDIFSIELNVSEDPDLPELTKNYLNWLRMWKNQNHRTFLLSLNTLCQNIFIGIPS